MATMWHVCLLILTVNMCSGTKEAWPENKLHEPDTRKDTDKPNYQLDDLWQTFKQVHQKKYRQDEESVRRKIWEANVETIRAHNLEYDMGLSTFTMGINEYSDLTFEEYKKYLLGARRPANPPKPTDTFRAVGNLEGLPDEVDWRKEGYVTPIKNQGQCGSCWAFSSTGALEGQHFRKSQRLVSLSEQNLVDCDKTNAGCNGGWMDNAFEYVQQNHGIDTEQYYPYQAEDMPTCTYNPDYSGSGCTGHVDIEKGNEKALQAASAKVGPIAVAIDATHQSFMNYRSGVYIEPACTNMTDHAVLVVGYGTYQNQPYWLVKNSWGTSWGMDGYIMMARNRGNMCAIASYASYPLV